MFKSDCYDRFGYFNGLNTHRMPLQDFSSYLNLVLVYIIANFPQKKVPAIGMRDELQWQ